MERRGDEFLQHFDIDVAVIGAILQARLDIQTVLEGRKPFVGVHRHRHQFDIVVECRLFHSRLKRFTRSLGSDSLLNVFTRKNKLLRQIPLERSLQVALLDRLGQIIGKTHRQERLADFGRAFRSQCNDGRILVDEVFQGLHLAIRFHAIHHRHHMVQENQVIMLGLCKLQTLGAAHRHVHLHLETPQESTEHLKVQLDIVYNQDARLGS